MTKGRQPRLRSALVGASLAALALTTVGALAGSGVGGEFQLGKGNAVNRPTSLTAASAKSALRVRNKGKGAAIEAVVRRGAAPFRVNSIGKVANLNADLLDGTDGDSYQRRINGTCAGGSAIRVIGAGGGVTCQSISTAFWSLTGNAGTGASSFLGTTDAQPLILKTNNNEVARITAGGDVAIGKAAPDLGTKLDVAGRIQAVADDNTTIVARTKTQTGVDGHSDQDVGVSGSSNSGVGTSGLSFTGYGMFASTDTGIGLHAVSNSNRAVEAISSTVAVYGNGQNGIGVHGNSDARGVVGTLGGTSCAGVYAIGGCTGTAVAYAVWGRNATGSAVVGSSDSGNVFLGVTTAAETHVARIDHTGKGFFNGGTQTGGADYAESIRAHAARQLEPGDVLAVDPQRGYAVRKSNRPNSRLVAGVYSAKPAVLAVGNHRVDDRLRGEVPVAMVGVVPTKVTKENGAIRPGDLLTTSSTPGYGMRAKPVRIRGVEIYPTGAILGKALEPLRTGRGMIKVLIMLR